MFSRGIMEIQRDQAVYLEECTRLQAKSQLWFEQRIGRITSSKFFQVSRASLDPPPSSLVREIMERRPVSAPALQWGITNEATAQEAFVESATKHHTNFSFEHAGLHVNPAYPHLGASPDGVISCDCCGEGLLEIKCPYKYRNNDLSTVNDPKFYLQQSDDGKLALSHNHAYYHQIQGQLAICERAYCDFVCWTLRGIHTERIELESSYLGSVKTKLDAFFVKAILPLLLTGKTNSSQLRADPTHSADPTPSADPSPSETFCWCGKEAYGNMVACDNLGCKVEWFHYDCAGLKRKPKGTWFCSSECKQQHCQ